MRHSTADLGARSLRFPSFSFAATEGTPTSSWRAPGASGVDRAVPPFVPGLIGARLSRCRRAWGSADLADLPERPYRGRRALDVAPVRVPTGSTPAGSPDLGPGLARTRAGAMRRETVPRSPTTADPFQRRVLARPRRPAAG